MTNQTHLHFQTLKPLSLSLSPTTTKQTNNFHLISLVLKIWSCWRVLHFFSLLLGLLLLSKVLVKLRERNFLYRWFCIFKSIFFMVILQRNQSIAALFYQSQPIHEDPQWILDNINFSIWFNFIESIWFMRKNQIWKSNMTANISQRVKKYLFGGWRSKASWLVV